MSKGDLILRSQLRQFEEDTASFIGVKQAVGLNSGTDALFLSLKAAGIGVGDEVITVAHTFVATLAVIVHCGATPVLVDVADDMNMDVDQVEAKISPRTKAIIPVDLNGRLCDMGKLMKIADKHNLKIVEDACQAHGAAFKNKRAGSFGDLGCFSFYPTKNLGGYGDSGAITTNSKALYEKCVMLRNYGQKNRYIHVIKGMNSRMDELQASILNVKLNHLDYFVKKRITIAQIYLSNLNEVMQIQLPRVRNHTLHSFHLFVIQTENRSKLKEFLDEEGIETQIHYPIPIHKQECYKEFNTLRLPVTEKASDTILSLPIHPFLTGEEVLYICSAIKKFYKLNFHKNL